jgi:hypothetical protein
MSTQPTFNHPELAYTQAIPKKDWRFSDCSCNGKTSVVTYTSDCGVTRIITFDLMKNADKKQTIFSDNSHVIAKISYFEDGSIFEDFFFEDVGTISYRRKISPNQMLEEEWFDGSGKTTALRRTLKGMLSCEDAAVVIWRPNGHCRKETWKYGVLLQVNVIDKDASEVVHQVWEDGKCTFQHVDLSKRKDICARDLALPLDQVSELPKITLADEARKMTPENPTDTELLNTIAHFESILRQRARQGNHSFIFDLHHSFADIVIKLLREAGYRVDHVVCTTNAFGITKQSSLKVSF